MWIFFLSFLYFQLRWAKQFFLYFKRWGALMSSVFPTVFRRRKCCRILAYPCGMIPVLVTSCLWSSELCERPRDYECPTIPRTMQATREEPRLIPRRLTCLFSAGKNYGKGQNQIPPYGKGKTLLFSVGRRKPEMAIMFLFILERVILYTTSDISWKACRKAVNVKENCTKYGRHSIADELDESDRSRLSSLVLAAEHRRIPRYSFVTCDSEVKQQLRRNWKLRWAQQQNPWNLWITVANDEASNTYGNFQSLHSALSSVKLSNL